MPRYELCYILAAQVSDDQVPGVASQIRQFVTDFGGTEVQEEQLGKKKLAYPIKKTRNGFYVCVQFTMDSRKVNDLEAKIRTQTGTIIRHLVVNLDEHIRRSEIDAVAQSKLSKRPEDGSEGESPAPAAVAPVATPVVAEVAPAIVEEAVETPEIEIEPAPKKEPVTLSSEDLDKQIEAALSEDIV